MHPALTQIQHRPWPLPETSWLWRQSWNELLFVHYRIDAKSIAALVPGSLKLQEFDGSAWVGVVPFQMNQVMRRPLPNLPWFSNFLELNVRLYVEHEGVPGVYFLSLDATNPLVVWGGRRFFSLPYRNARMSQRHINGVTTFKSETRSNKQIGFEVEFRPTSEIFFSRPGTLEHFLTERYCFYTQGSKGVLRADIHHWPWPLQTAAGEIRRVSVLDGLELDRQQRPLLHYSSGVDVISWNPVAERVKLFS